MRVLKAWVKGSTWIPIFDVDYGLDIGTIPRKVTNFAMGIKRSVLPLSLHLCNQSLNFFGILLHLTRCFEQVVGGVACLHWLLTSMKYPILSFLCSSDSFSVHINFIYSVISSLQQLVLTQSYGEVPQRCRINRCMPEGSEVSSIHSINRCMLTIGTATCVLSHISSQILVGDPSFHKCPNQHTM